MAEGQSKINPVMLIAVVSVLVVLLAGGASYLIVSNLLESKAPLGSAKKEIGPLYSMQEEIVANLADEGSEHFVKAKITLELDNKKTLKEMEERSPQIRDTLISTLRSKQTSDIKAKDGLNKLRQEIMNKCNEKLIAGKVVNVYFTDFVMQ